MPTARLLAVLFSVTLFALNADAKGGATLHGNPYAPAGAGYTIFSLQGIDMSHMFGQNNDLSQVNTDFEFDGGIGVTYTDPTSGHLTDFGIGLYQGAANSVFSTGLRIALNQPTDAAGLTITLADFDIQSGKDKFFNPKKVEPGILLLGPNGTVYANASPTDIFSLLTPDTAALGGKKKGKGSDVWDLNFGALLKSLNLADTQITGYVLYADSKNGENNKSDPYFFISQSFVSPSTNL
ncbi:MAG TPA: hypothetical protein VLK27_01530 [Chthoniobacterales bacterium]|nr:hypothetical protein [Chthoniobacterales bacterium]